MKTVILLVLVTFSWGAAAQKPKPKPDAEDASQKIRGTVTIRNDDGSVRPAPFVQVRIYEPQRDGLTDLVGAWKSEKSKFAEGSKGLSQFPIPCQEVMSAASAVANSAAVFDRAKKDGNWERVEEFGLAQYDHFYTDKDGNFDDDLVLVHGNLLVIAFLVAPTRSYYWEEQITVRKGEKTPPAVLTDPVVCHSTEGSK